MRTKEMKRREPFRRISPKECRIDAVRPLLGMVGGRWHMIYEVPARAFEITRARIQSEMEFLKAKGYDPVKMPSVLADAILKKC